jgi:crossover junction endodeoxyribonuclease RuvC
MLTTYIGIDPGKTGALAILAPTENLVYDVPLIGKDYDVRSMATLILHAGICLGETLACIEHASSRPGEGVASSFTAGYGYGLWIGILSSLAVAYRTVRPSTWKREMGVSADKDLSRAKARALFPLLDLSLKKHHGRAEALLLAQYAREKMTDTRRDIFLAARQVVAV